MFIRFAEYLQLISLAIFLNFPDNLNEDQRFVPKAIAYFFKLINPSWLLDFNSSHKAPQVVLLIIFCITVLKYILICYVISAEYCNNKINRVLSLVWKWTFKIQGPVLCIFTTSFASRAIISASLGDFKLVNMNKTGILVISIFLIVIEYILSFIAETQFCEVLPTNKFFSSKNSHTRTIVLCQKLVLQILITSFQSHNVINLWIFTIPIILFSIVNNYHFYTRLPFYNFQALLFQGKLLCLVISFDIACLMNACLKEGGYIRAGLNLTIILWIIISLLAMKFSEELTQRISNDLLTENPQGNPELLVHRVIMSEYLKKNLKIPGEKAEKYDLTYLLSQSKEAKENKAFKTSKKKTLESENNDEIVYKKSDQFYLNFLEGLLQKFPNDSFIKLHLAHLCSENPTLFPKTIQIVSELGKNKYSYTYLNSLLLLYKIEKAIINKYDYDESNLDFSTYLKSQVYLEDFKKDIIEQIRLKIKVCENMTGEISDIGEIFNCGQLIYQSKNRIEKKINTLFNFIPNHYTSPLLLCAEYYLVLQYSLKNYEKYQKQYSRKKLRNEKVFQENILNEENLYQEGNGFLLLSGEKGNPDTIKLCSKGLEDICGIKRSKYYGAQITSIFVQSLQAYYKRYLRQVTKGNYHLFSDQFPQEIPFFLYHREKYMIEAQVHLQIHPYITKNLYFDMIVRPIKSAKEYILIKENGDIESATRSISMTLHINYFTSQLTNIKFISEELFRANQAFNFIHKNKFTSNSKQYDNNLRRDSQKKHSTESTIFTNHNEALELHLTYTSTGKNIYLQPLGRSHYTINYPYCCKVSIIQGNSSVTKLITLEKATGEITERERNISPDTLKTDRSKGKRPVFFPDLKEYNLEEAELEESNILTGSENIQSPERESGELSPRITTDGNLISTRNLLAPTLTSPGLKRTTFLKPQQKDFNREDFLSSRSSRKENEDIADELGRFETKIENNENFVHDVVIPEVQDVSFDQELSNYSKYKRQDKIFQREVAFKSYPKTFNLWTTIFYGVILITFASQFVLFEVSNKTMDNLVVKKNLLKYAQVRFYRLVVVNINAMGAFIELEGYYTSNEVLRGAIASIENIYFHLPELTLANQRLVEDIKSLDTDIKKQLFYKDVRMIGTSTDVSNQILYNVTQFQAIDELVSASKALIASPDPGSVEVYNLFSFILLNTLDDFVYKNFEMTSLFMNLVNKEKDYFQFAIFLCLIVTPILLLLVALLLILIIGAQYIKEKNYLLAFIKLNQKKVAIIQKGLKAFEKSLVNEEEFGNNQSMLLFMNITNLKKDKQENNFHKKQQTQVIKDSTLKSRYLKYVTKVTGYVAVLIIILVVNFLTANSLKETIYRRQSQLQFANQLSTTVTLTFATSAYVFVFNDSLSINHTQSFKEQKKQAEETKWLKEQILTVFEEQDGSYDSDIENILFYDTNCTGLTNTSLYYCSMLSKQYHQRTNLVAAMDLFEILLKYKIFYFENSNRTSIPLLVNVTLSDQNLYLPTFIIVSAQADLIANIIDRKLTQDISHARSQRILFLVIFSICMLFVSLLIWYHILSKLREIDNDFKRVLQIFPSTLILSSFLLKSFLKNSSRDIFPL